MPLVFLGTWSGLAVLLGWQSLQGSLLGQVLLSGLTASSTQALHSALLIFGTPQGTQPCPL